MNAVCIGAVSLFLLLLGTFMGLLAVANASLLAATVSAVVIFSAMTALQEAEDLS